MAKDQNRVATRRNVAEEIQKFIQPKENREKFIKLVEEMFKLPETVTLSSIAEELDWVLFCVQKGIERGEKNSLQIKVLNSLKDLEENVVKSEIRNRYSDFNGSTILHLPAALGMNFLTKYLIEKGADVNAKDDNGNTPLHRVIMEYKKNDGTLTSTISHLVQGGADIEAKNSAEHSPLDLSKKFKRIFRENPVTKVLEKERKSYLEKQQNSTGDALEESDKIPEIKSADEEVKPPLESNSTTSSSEVVVDENESFGFYDEKTSKEEMQNFISKIYSKSYQDDASIKNDLEKIFEFASPEQKLQLINDNNFTLSQKAENQEADRGTILHALIEMKKFDVALKLIEDNPLIALDVQNQLEQNYYLAAIEARAPKKFIEEIAQRSEIEFGFGGNDKFSRDAEMMFILNDSTTDDNETVVPQSEVALKEGAKSVGTLAKEQENIESHKK